MRSTRCPPVPEVFDLLVADAEHVARGGLLDLQHGLRFRRLLPRRRRRGRRRGGGADRLRRRLLAGVVRAGPRRVVLEPVGVTYDSGALQLAPGA